MVYFARCHANPLLILLWPYYCASRRDTFMGNFSLYITLFLSISLWFGLICWSKRNTLYFRYLFIAALLVGLQCRISYLITTPTFYAPDEQSHFNYIKYLSENLSLPVQTSKVYAPTNDYEYYQPPLYYMAMVPIYCVSKTLFHEEFLIVRGIRSFSILLWLINIWLGLRFFRHLKISNDFLRIAFIVLICLLPTYTFMSSVINNDNLLITIGGAILCIVAQKDYALRKSILIGFLLGVAMLTKLSAIVYFPLVIVMFGFEIVKNRKDRISLVSHLVLILTIAVVVFAPWAIRNWYLYKSITALNIGSIPVYWPSISNGIISSLGYMSHSFWAVSGIYNKISSYFSVIGILVTFFAIIGLIYCVVLKSKYFLTIFSEENWEFCIAMAVGIIINVLLVLRYGLLYGQGQGRFLFPISLFIVFGLGSYPVKNATSM